MKRLSLTRMIGPLSDRDFRLLWIGQTISALGNSFQVIAVTWLVLQQLKGSPLDLALAMLALSIPRIPLTLAGGIITDRLDPRTVMLWSDATRVATSGALGLLAVTGYAPLWLLCMLLSAHSVATGIFDPAAGSIPPHLVPREQLDGANSLMALISQLGTLIGALPAGLVVATLGTAAAFVINALSFAVAVLAALLMAPLARALRETKKSLLHDARDGVRYVMSFPWLIALLLIDTCAALAAIGPTSVGLPLIARDVLHVGAEGYSLLLWSFGLGSVLGFILSGVYSPTRARGRFFCLIQILEAPLLAGVAFTPLPLMMFCLAGVGLLNGMLLVLFLSLIQANVAKEMLGRVMSFVMLASVGFVPLSLYGSGAIAGTWGTRILFLVAGALTLVSATAGLFVRCLRRLD
ncbi:MFS transporter [Ktedonobacter sp. SOSP1-52]|uniref:MFS transporter n=1 Tax=Ktedonobacter sp. SOSP1-52 TaxID=2778366 RepID=UPI0019169E90|nr:MFS transporter [Ktedonobacter sp. SOSP1-52]GHO64526.1 MFS transporter [Ktedonobacter sp. SOSP1-52]